YNRPKSAARTEVTFDFGPQRLCPAHHIFENLIDNVLLENSQIAIGLQIFFVRFQFEAAFVGHITKDDYTEIWQSGLGANGGELGVVNDDFISRKLVGPGFDLREFCIKSCLGMLGCIAWLLRHTFYCTQALSSAMRAARRVFSWS